VSDHYSVDNLPANNMARDMINRFYDELSATICSCMAAGVPASAFIVTQPQLQVDGNVVSMVCHIGFKEVKL
jgi:hypothetical protein